MSCSPASNTICASRILSIMVLGKLNYTLQRARQHGATVFSHMPGASDYSLVYT